MSSKLYSLECFKVANSIDKVIVNKCYNLDLSVGDLYYQVIIPDSDLSNSSLSCFTFVSPDDAMDFIKLNVKI